MKTLNNLLEPGPWQELIEDGSCVWVGNEDLEQKELFVYGNMVMVDDQDDRHEENAAYLVALNPVVVAALLRECLAARKMMDFKPLYEPLYTCDLDSEDYDAAIHATDATIGGEK